VAIGGIGMSALARIAAAKGCEVSGCDRVESPVLAALRAAGSACEVGHSPAHVANADVVVHSSAVPLGSPELRAARSRGVPVFSRGEMLAWLHRDTDTVAVAGAHGKTTTTWLIANALIRAGADPTVAVGGHVAELGGNARVGRSRLFVTEADESDGSFLLLEPKYPVITNIDLEHLDYYSGIEAIERAFTAFAEKAGDDGVLIACVDCPRVRRLLERVSVPRITCGVGRGDVSVENMALGPARTVFDVRLPTGVVRDVALSLPGTHNVQNALAALAVAVELGLDIGRVVGALAQTPPVGRRLECRGREAGVTVYDDYAHHPVEIRAVLACARRLAPGRLVGVFQPHRYTRTERLWREFGAAFDGLDLLLLAPIYAASEPPIEGVTAALIAGEVEANGRVAVELVPDLPFASGRLSAELGSGDTLITLGAGDVWQVGEAVLRDLAQADAA